MLSRVAFAYKCPKFNPLIEKCPILLKPCRHMGNSVINNEYTKTPNYPPILALDTKNVYCRDRDLKLDKIKRLGTIEEKLIGINMPRYYGWSSLILNEGNFPFNILPFVQHITRTDIKELEKFPFSSGLSKNEMDNILNKIRPQLKEAIILEVLQKKYVYLILFNECLRINYIDLVVD